MRHLRTRIAGLTAVTSLTLAGCGGDQNQNGGFDWASEDLILLTSTGAEKLVQTYEGHVWGATVGQETKSLETRGLEAGQLLVRGDALHFDDREHSLALTAGNSEVTSVAREPMDALTSIEPMSDPEGIFRLYNDGWIDDEKIVQNRFGIEIDGALNVFSLPYSPLGVTQCAGTVYAVADRVISDSESFESPNFLLSIASDGHASVEGEWDAAAGGMMGGPMGCLGDQPRWTEDIYESENSETSTEAIVGLDANGERVVAPITVGGPRQLEAAIGQEQYAGQITCGGRTSSFDGGLYESCGDGALQRIDLQTGEVTTTVDASGLAQTSDGYVDAYVSEDGFVALATDYESDDLTLGIYDRDGVEVERRVFEGLAAEATNGGEGLYDFVAVQHPPLR